MLKSIANVEREEPVLGAVALMFVWTGEFVRPIPTVPPAVTPLPHRDPSAAPTLPPPSAWDTSTFIRAIRAVLVSIADSLFRDTGAITPTPPLPRPANPVMTIPLVLAVWTLIHAVAEAGVGLPVAAEFGRGAVSTRGHSGGGGGGGSWGGVSRWSGGGDGGAWRCCVRSGGGGDGGVWCCCARGGGGVGSVTVLLVRPVYAVLDPVTHTTVIDAENAVTKGFVGVASTGILVIPVRTVGHTVTHLGATDDIATHTRVQVIGGTVG